MYDSQASTCRPDLICFSHLRWDFVYQRPQHLMSRAARDYHVFFIEEPLFEAGVEPRLVITDRPQGVQVAVPVLPLELTAEEAAERVRGLVLGLLQDRNASNRVLWYYTPMAVACSRGLTAGAIVYDNMDELSAFVGAPPRLLALERELVAMADLVFTGGMSLYAAKKGRHKSVHAFPSSIDAAHFGKSRRKASADAEDQASIPHPRVGFFGVVDERMDLALVRQAAELRPDWQFVMLGPVVKIDPKVLPQRSNIHWLGSKAYADLPDYLRHWDAGFMPFALNEATRFISPTKTPEFLAAGLGVVSTPITDVIEPYGRKGLVAIAADAGQLVDALEIVLNRPRKSWLAEVARHLATTSWDKTWGEMRKLIDATSPSGASVLPAPNRPHRAPTPSEKAYKFDWMIVGAGFAGSVLAERLASQRNESVLLIDRRPHVGGNAFDRYNEHGLLIHEYGPHIFHTNSAEIFDHLSKFTEWRDYQHRVLADVDGQLVPIPINRTTIRCLYGLTLDTEEEVEAWFAARAEPVEMIRTSEDVVVSKVGRELYEKFFQGYTRKQWGLDPSELDKSVTGRVPTRTNTDDRYFNDRFQAMPKEGFTQMFERMLQHPNITVMLEAEYRDLYKVIPHRRVIYTGQVDEYFGFRYGKLPYRSLAFDHVTLDKEWHQSVGVVNYPQTEKYTRVTEYKHLTGQSHPKTALTYEYPSAVGDPYYPIPRPENQELYKRYEKLASTAQDVWFVGRLATYRYYNMDQVVGQALATYRRIDEAIGRNHQGGGLRQPIEIFEAPQHAADPPVVPAGTAARLVLRPVVG